MGGTVHDHGLEPICFVQQLGCNQQQSYKYYFLHLVKMSCLPTVCQYPKLPKSKQFQALLNIEGINGNMDNQQTQGFSLVIKIFFFLTDYLHL